MPITSSSSHKCTLKKQMLPIIRFIFIFHYMNNPLFGTCSFIYPSWDKLVYSSPHPQDPLAEYAQKYNMVEIDRWFWSLGKQSAGLPSPLTVDEYNRATDDSFRFTIKCPNALTLPFYPHSKEHNPYYLNRDFMHSFIESLDPIRDKIGLLMLQFGYINKEMNPNLESFIASLHTFFSHIDRSVPYGIELRNNQFLGGDWFEFLSSQSIAPVLLSGYWMDDICSTIDRFQSLFGPTISIRLHGEHRKEIEQVSGGNWNTILYDRERDLWDIAKRLLILKENHQLFVQVNNHYEGSAPLTIRRIESFMKEISFREEVEQ